MRDGIELYMVNFLREEIRSSWKSGERCWYKHITTHIHWLLYLHKFCGAQPLRFHTGTLYIVDLVVQDREKMHEIFRLVSIFFKEIGNVRLQGDGRAHWFVLVNASRPITCLYLLLVRNRKKKMKHPWCQFINPKVAYRNESIGYFFLTTLASHPSPFWRLIN